MDEKELQRLIEECQREMQDLYDMRRERAERRANMTEEEWLADYARELDEVLADAKAHRVNIHYVGDGEEGEKQDEE